MVVPTKRLHQAESVLRLSSISNFKGSVVVKANKEASRSNKRIAQFASMVKKGQTVVNLAMALEASKISRNSHAIATSLQGTYMPVAEAPATHLVGHADLTYFCEGIDAQLTSAPTDVTYHYDIGLFHNTETDEKKYTEPNLDPNTEGVIALSNTINLTEAFRLQGSLEDDIKRMSTILSAGNTFNAKLKEFFSSHGLPDTTATLITTGLISSSPKFKLHSAIEYSHRTSHYTVHFTTVKGTHDDGSFKIQTKRTVIIAQLHQAKTQKGQRIVLIPLGEELTIQILRDAGYGKTGLFISSRPNSQSALHFLGTNAMTINGSVPPGDGYTAIACAAQDLIEKLSLATSSSTSEAAKSQGFFSNIINDTKLRGHYEKQLRHETDISTPDDLAILKRSFVGKQRAFDLAASGKYSIKQWFTSIGHAVIVYSPVATPNKNFVFVWNKPVSSSDHVPPPPRIIEPKVSDVSIYPTDPPAGPVIHSSLPLDLELELELL